MLGLLRSRLFAAGAAQHSSACTPGAGLPALARCAGLLCARRGALGPTSSPNGLRELSAAAAHACRLAPAAPPGLAAQPVTPQRVAARLAGSGWRAAWRHAPKPAAAASLEATGLRCCGREAPALRACACCGGAPRAAPLGSMLRRLSGSTAGAGWAVRRGAAGGRCTLVRSAASSCGWAAAQAGPWAGAGAALGEQGFAARLGEHARAVTGSHCGAASPLQGRGWAWARAANGGRGFAAQAGDQARASAGGRGGAAGLAARRRAGAGQRRSADQVRRRPLASAPPYPTPTRAAVPSGAVRRGKEVRAVSSNPATRRFVAIQRPDDTSL